MAKKILTVKYFNGGIGDSDKEGVRGSFYLTTNLDIFSEPTNLTLNPKTAKDSGTTVVDLVKWIVSGAPYDTNLYFYGDTGKLYQRTSAGSWSVLRTVSSSCGQGMDIFNDYLYYTQNTQIGRYGLLSGTPSFTDAWQTGLDDTSAAGKRFSPVKAFANGLAVGHGDNLGWWDGTVWDVDRLTFPPGYNVRTLDVVDEYLVIGTWKGSAIQDSESGIVFFWDGSATTYNFFVSIQEGGIQALVNSRNRLLSVAGADGVIYLNYNPFQKVHKIPFLPASKYLEVYPGAICNWKGAALIGIAANTDSTALIQGVYQWSSKSDKYNETLTLAYTPSHNLSQAITLHIGSVKGYGDELYIGWQNDTTYGVDRVITTASPFASGTYQSLLFDDNRPLQEKQAITLKATHKPLVSGESIQLGYKTNRASSYTTDTANSTVGSTVTRLPIQTSMARFYEYQFEVILATTGSTNPTITSIGLEYDDLTAETLV